MVFRESSNRANLTSGAGDQIQAMFITRVVGRSIELIYLLRKAGKWRTGYGPCLNRDGSVNEIDFQSVDADLCTGTSARIRSDDEKEPDIPRDPYVAPQPDDRRQYKRIRSRSRPKWCASATTSTAVDVAPSSSSAPRHRLVSDGPNRPRHSGHMPEVSSIITRHGRKVEDNENVGKKWQMGNPYYATRTQKREEISPQSPKSPPLDIESPTIDKESPKQIVSTLDALQRQKKESGHTSPTSQHPPSSGDI